MNKKHYMSYETVETLNDNDSSVVIIDQTKLPGNDRDHKASYGKGDLGCHLSAEGSGEPPAIGLRQPLVIYVLARPLRARLAL